MATERICSLCMVPKEMISLFAPDVKEAFYHRLYAMYAPYFGKVAASPAHLVQMTRDNLDERRSLDQLKMFAASTGELLQGKKMLEVGSGIGLTVATARKFLGVEAYGIEPGDDEYEGSLKVSWDILRAAGVDASVIQHGVGEAIPYPDDQFDLVYSSNVLEHVNEPPKVIAEIVRVLKPGGYAQIVVPNYGSWWEGHYGVLWIPHLPAALGKAYVRLLGRDPQFIDTLQLVTRGKLERWVAPHRDRIEILGWGVDTWEERVRGLGFSEYSALGRLKAMLKVLHKVKVIPALIGVGKALHWETPLILTFRKIA
jgi:SAM-dependent methyltransferase